MMLGGRARFFFSYRNPRLNAIRGTPGRGGRITNLECSLLSLRNL